MTRELGPGEAHVSEYRVPLDTGALTLGRKLEIVISDGRRARADTAELVATDAIVGRELVSEYVDSREWERRPVDVVRAPDGSLLVLDGHHRIAAAHESGAPTVPVYMRENL